MQSSNLISIIFSEKLTAGKFEIKESSGDKFRFDLKAGNGQIILSSESYESK